MITQGSAPGGHRFRAMLSRVGPCGPIEERIGRRLVRLVAPDTEKGLRLLRSGKVSLVSPEGDELGPLPLDDALEDLRKQLEKRLRSATSPEDRDALRLGLEALHRWEERCSDL